MEFKDEIKELTTEYIEHYYHKGDLVDDAIIEHLMDAYEIPREDGVIEGIVEEIESEVTGIEHNVDDRLLKEFLSDVL